MSLASNPYLRLRHPAPEQYFLSKLFNAGKIQFHRRRTPENRYRYLQPAVVAVDLLDRAVEIRKRPIHDAHLLVALGNNFRLWAIRRNVHAIADRIHFRLGTRRRRIARPHKPTYTRPRTHSVPGVFLKL